MLTFPDWTAGIIESKAISSILKSIPNLSAIALPISASIPITSLFSRYSYGGNSALVPIINVLSPSSPLLLLPQAVNIVAARTTVINNASNFFIIFYPPKYIDFITKLYTIILKNAYICNNKDF